VLEDGETVSLGGTTLEAIWAPGHTPGCTVWSMRAPEADKTYAVVFYGCVRPNDSVQLIGNPKFPHLVEETTRTFQRMRGLAPDIYLTMHPEELFAGKLDRIRSGARPHPLDNPSAWTKLLDEVESDFAERLRNAQGQQRGPR
jgi:metallo-beta-lactamase class B